MISRANDTGPLRDEKGRILPGKHLPSPGRKGIPNKIPRKAVEQVLLSLDERGGVAYLNKLSDAHFTRLLARILPTDSHVTADVVTETIEEWLRRKEREAREGKPGEETP